jgi:hypothetical protein
MTGNFEISNIHNSTLTGIGHGAQVTGPPAAELTQLQRKIAELEALVERHAPELADGDIARDAVAEAAREARSEEPERQTLRRLLSTIAGAATNVSAVTAAVSSVRALLGAP